MFLKYSGILYIQDPIQDFTIPLKSLSSWFTEETVSKKREEIENIVMQLNKEQTEKAGVSWQQQK